MPAPEQIVFPFASLDFPGRGSVTLAEISEKLRCSVEHLLNEVEAGAFPGALDIKGTGASRRTIRVPIEGYRAYVLQRMTGPWRADFVRDLPRATRRELLRETVSALLDDTPEPKLRAALRSLQTFLQ